MNALATLDDLESMLGAKLIDYEHLRPSRQRQFTAKDFIQRANRSASDPGELPADAPIAKLCKVYSESSDETREAIRRMVPNRPSLWHFACRMAIQAMRKRSADSIRLGLTSLLIENGRSDPRETIAGLAMLYHACKSIGATWSELTAQSLKLSAQPATRILEEFSSRPDEMKGLSWYCLQETRDENGVTIAFLVP